MAEESRFKRQLIKEIERRFPGAIVLKIDANHIQGIPDEIILCGKHWSVFEAKDDISSSHRPNQDYYVRLLNRMSHARFVYPQNAEEYLDELQQTLRPRR